MALFLAGVANRIIGTVYRVLLVRAAGEEVIGIFQMTLPVYRVASTLAGAGMHVAIARLSADASGSADPDAARRYGRVGVALTLFTALLAAFALFATRGLWANHFLTDRRTIVALSVLPLLLVPAALCQALRGVLQGEERLLPLAYSGLAEAISRVPIVLFLVAWLLPLGPEWAAGGIAAGLAAGEVVSLVLLLWFISRSKLAIFKRAAAAGRPQRLSSFFARNAKTAAALTAVAVPLLFSGLVNGILGMFNVALIPRQLLASGMDAAEATIQYGRLFGMALPVLYMPMVAIHPIVQASIPAVARRIAEGRTKAVRRLLFQCFGAAAAVATCSSLAFLLFGEQIGRALYGIDGLGALITPLAVAAPFAYLGHVAAGVLYGLGRTGITMANTIAGNIMRLSLIYLLVANPAWGIRGALWAVVADYALTSILDLAAAYVLMRRSLRPQR